MKRVLHPLSFIAVLLVISACAINAPPSIHDINENYIGELEQADKRWEKVAVLPFTGNEAFTRTSAEYFSFLVNKHYPIEIIGPALTGIWLEKEQQTNAGKSYDIWKANDKIADALDADVIITGTISSISREGLTVSVHVIDGMTGITVATFVEAGIKQIPAFNMWDMEMWRKAVFTATENAAYEFIGILYQFDGITWQRPLNRYSTYSASNAE